LASFVAPTGDDETRAFMGEGQGRGTSDASQSAGDKNDGSFHVSSPCDPGEVLDALKYPKYIDGNVEGEDETERQQTWSLRRDLISPARSPRTGSAANTIILASHLETLPDMPSRPGVAAGMMLGCGE
jgi:hypothetical protein